MSVKTHILPLVHVFCMSDQTVRVSDLGGWWWRGGDDEKNKTEAGSRRSSAGNTVDLLNLQGNLAISSLVQESSAAWLDLTA